MAMPPWFDVVPISSTERYPIVQTTSGHVPPVSGTSGLDIYVPARSGPNPGRANALALILRQDEQLVNFHKPRFSNDGENPGIVARRLNHPVLLDPKTLFVQLPLFVFVPSPDHFNIPAKRLLLGLIGELAVSIRCVSQIHINYGVN